MRRTGIAAAALAVSVLGGAGAYYVAAGQATPARPAAEQTSRAEEYSLPQRWTQRAVTPEQEEAGILLRLERTQPAAVFLMRSIVGNLDRGVDVAAVADATAAALRRELRGLDTLSRQTVVNQDQQIAHLQYEQTSPKGRAVTDLYVLPTQRQTFYLSFRSDAAAHEALSAEREAILDQVVATIQEKTR